MVASSQAWSPRSGAPTSSAPSSPPNSPSANLVTSLKRAPQTTLSPAERSLLLAPLPDPTPSETFLSPIEGVINVFTCNHRNFFAQVMAEALRSAGQGTAVLVVQFLKGGCNQGPGSPVRLGQNLDWIRCNLPHCPQETPFKDEEIEAIQALWSYAQQSVLEGAYGLVVLDELSLAVAGGAIALDAVLTFLDQRPRSVDVVLTGPQMPEEWLDRADQITELRHRKS